MGLMDLPPLRKVREVVNLVREILPTVARRAFPKVPWEKKLIDLPPLKNAREVVNLVRESLPPVSWRLSPLVPWWMIADKPAWSQLNVHDREVAFHAIVLKQEFPNPAWLGEPEFQKYLHGRLVTPDTLPPECKENPNLVDWLRHILDPERMRSSRQAKQRAI